MKMLILNTHWKMESVIKLETNSTAQVIGQYISRHRIRVQMCIQNENHSQKKSFHIYSSGPTNVGKSTFVYNLLKQANGAFSKPIKAIYYCYSVDQPLFAEMKKAIRHINFFEGLPTKTELETLYMNEPGEKILVIDDMMTESAKSKDVVDIYCKYAHHFKFFCFLICQNAFCPSREFRTISLNTHYFFLFKNNRDELQIQTLGRQILPGKLKYFMDAYKKATLQKYGYLLVDLSPHSEPKYKLRTNILPDQLMSVFVPDK